MKPIDAPLLASQFTNATVLEQQMPELKYPLADDPDERSRWAYEPASPLPASGALISVDGDEYVITLAPDQHANASLWRVREHQASGGTSRR
jgi:hypothetical protein